MSFVDGWKKERDKSRSVGDGKSYTDGRWEWVDRGCGLI